MSVKNRLKWQIRKLLIDHYPKLIIDHEWPAIFGHPVDWDNPKDLNEKIQWLISYSDTSEWTRLTDKVKVREFVEERGYGHLLTRLYGVWENADDIDYNSLPERFVLKCTHDSGSTILVDKARGYDKGHINATLDDRLRQKFGYLNCEPHYNKIPPRIIAEEYLQGDFQYGSSTSLVDYKLWAFDGQVEHVWTYYNRTRESVYGNVYDLDWVCHPEYSAFHDGYRNGGGILPRPQCLDEMISAAAALSAGFPQVRVDFYEVGGKLYFGEMTFTSNKGRMQNYTQEYLRLLGDKVKLPKKRCPFK